MFKQEGDNENLSDSLLLNGVSELRVSKDIVVSSSEDGTARVLRIEQHYSEAPEAGASLLLALGLLFGGALRLRRA